MTLSRVRRTVYCERLTVRTLIGTVMPILVRARPQAKGAPPECFYIDASRLARLLVPICARIVRTNIQQLGFRLVDLHDDSGRLIRLLIDYMDMAEVQDDVTADPMFRAFVESAGLTSLEAAYLTKGVAINSFVNPATTWRALLLVRVVAWRTRHDGSAPAVLVLERRPWQRALDTYAQRHGVAVVSVRPSVRFAETARALLRPRRIAALRRWRDRLGHVTFLQRQGVPLKSAIAAAARAGGGLVTNGPKILVVYHGQFNVTTPACYSDVFFWHESGLSGQDLVLVAGLPQEPIDASKLADLKRHGITPVSVCPGASTSVDVPIFIPSSRGRHGRGGRRPPMERRREWQWMQEQIETYDEVRNHWEELFAATDAMVSLTWYRFEPRVYAITDAIRRRGGVAALYQRSLQIDPTREMAVEADIMFGFSPLDGEIERRSGSHINYHVAVGYTADHRVKYVGPAAAAIRARLHEKGATRIVAYFDESSTDDSRWHTGHEFMRENYAFVLERLLADATLGLVIKPKKPGTLRSRLGPVAQLLERAMASGRCHMCEGEGGPLHGVEPPVLAALAADMVIHGHLCASTAGLEAALAGVPTLLLDREGWPGSMMFDLGVGRVAFTTWPDLWDALEEHWRRPGGLPGFGQWNPLIERLDPFRDGRAAERMGDYLDWVITGIRAGQDRETVLANAADRYTARWGRDKITRGGGRRDADCPPAAPAVAEPNAWTPATR